MNWLDILLIVIVVGLVLLIVVGIKEWAYELSFASAMFIGLAMLGFIIVDPASGSTLGTITSVDKNFFGTTALYIKTSETTQEKYCIEFDEKLENKANELIGKKVKISYGKRVGLYSTGKCSQAPVESIEEVNK